MSKNMGDYSFVNYGADSITYTPYSEMKKPEEKFMTVNSSYQKIITFPVPEFKSSFFIPGWTVNSAYSYGPYADFAYQTNQQWSKSDFYTNIFIFQGSQLKISSHFEHPSTIELDVLLNSGSKIKITVTTPVAGDTFFDLGDTIKSVSIGMIDFNQYPKQNCDPLVSSVSINPVDAIDQSAGQNVQPLTIVNSPNVTQNMIPYFFPGPMYSSDDDETTAPNTERSKPSGPAVCKSCNTMNEYLDASTIEGDYVCYGCKKYGYGGKK